MPTRLAPIWHAGAPVDLIFSDAHMPGSMDGLDLARRIRNERPLPTDHSHLGTYGRPGRTLAAAILLLPKPYELGRAVALVRRALQLPGLVNGRASGLHPHR